MKGASRMVPAALGLAPGGSAAFTRTPPGRTDPVLGRFHLRARTGRADFDDAAARAWGANRERYIGIEAYCRNARALYFGGELGRSGAARALNADGNTIRGFDFWNLELNEKMAFELRRGWAFDVGLGGAFFYVDGREVSLLGGQEVGDPLADVGIGAQPSSTSPGGPAGSCWGWTPGISGPSTSSTSTTRT